MFFLSFFLSFNSFISFAQITIQGVQRICVGETEVFKLLNKAPNKNYYWSTSPTQSVSQQSNDDAVIQWNNQGTYILIVTEVGGGQVATKQIDVYKTYKPFVTFDNTVGCQKLHTELLNVGNEIIDNLDNCLNVCENSRVTYEVHGTQINGLYYSNFDWQINGGVIISADGINQPLGTTSYTSNGVFNNNSTLLVVEWGGVGNASLKVKETTIYISPGLANATHCLPKETIICFNIIDRPQANYTVDDLAAPPPQGQWYDICKNQTVYFKDLSVATSGSDILFWEWDFGDGSPKSHQIHPHHKYITAGTYDVFLTVTNRCGCSNVFGIAIRVDAADAIDIECPAVVCEYSNVEYMANAACNPYAWSITGGNIIQQNDPNITVKWDNVGSDGFGYITLDGSYCNNVCPAKTKIRVPIVTQTADIDGPLTTCINKNYTYTLPPWPATNFKWKISGSSSAAAFNTLDQRENIMEIGVGAIPGIFDLECEYINTLIFPYCGGKANTISIIIKDQPTIETTKLHCIGTPLQVDIIDINNLSLGGTNDWTILKPDGSLITQQTTATAPSLNATTFNMPGMYRLEVKSINYTFCEPEPIMVKIIDKPSTPTYINGEVNICEGYPYTYTVDEQYGAVNNWQVSGGIIQGNSYGNSIVVIWNSGTPKTITVQREWEKLNSCQSSPLTISVNTINVNGAITGLSSTYEDKVDFYEFIPSTPGLEAETYIWKLSNSSIGNISSGQGTHKVEVTWYHLATPQSLSLSCDFVKCGHTYTFTLAIYVAKSTAISSVSISPSANICSGETVTFTANTTGPPAFSFNWDFGDGTVTTSTLNTATHTYHNMSNASVINNVVVEVLNANGMVTDVETTQITIKPQPNVYLTPASPVTVPPAVIPIQLSVSNTYSGNYHYLWKFKEQTAPISQTIGGNQNTYDIITTLPAGAASYFGDYWCIITNTAPTNGCVSITNKMIVKPYTGSTTGGGCNPVQPVGINGFPTTITTTLPCGQVQISCTVDGTTGSNGNINGFAWTTDAPVNEYTVSGNGSLTQSPLFIFNKAGMHKIILSVFYDNQTTGGYDCVETAEAYVIVPTIADMQWGISCNNSNGSYDLELFDYSSVYPGYQIQSWSWTISSTTNGTIVNNNPNCVISNLTPGSTQNISFSIYNGINTCTATTSIVLPSLPQANYTAITTYPTPGAPYKSCQNREIILNNTSTPMGGIIMHQWDFDDYTYSHLKEPKKVYANGGQPLLKTIYLTVTDKYGCTSIKSEPFSIYYNNISFVLGSRYTPINSQVCVKFNGALSPPITPQFSGSATPLNYSYQWYKDKELLPGVISPELLQAAAGGGAYWVRISDQHNCYLELNPTPAIIAEINGPTAIIEGNDEICEGDDIELTAITGMPASSNLIYTWQCFQGVSGGGGAAVSGGSFTTKSISHTLSSTIATNYHYTLTVSDGVCPQIAQPINIKLNPIPPKPSIVGPIAINCDEYELSLTANSSVSPAPKYNWSTGQNAQAISVFNGGTYRVWITDHNNCKSHEDIAIPYPPDYYFWRWPSGCYTFCEPDMPRALWPSAWTFGNTNITFDKWAWRKNGIDVVQNGPLSYICPFGSSTTPSIPCRLWLDNSYAYGEGSGNYNWMLDNGLCLSESDMMYLNIDPCQELLIDIDELLCLNNLPNGINYYFSLHVPNSPCTGSYTLAAEDNTGFPIPITNSTLQPINYLQVGPNSISGQCIALLTATDIKFSILLSCGPGNLLSGATLLKSLPPCPGHRLNMSDSTNFVDTIGNTILNIYPNPASDLANVEYDFAIDNSELNKQYQLVLMNTNGKILESKLLENSFGSYKLDVQKYSTGIYFVGLLKNGKRIIAKNFIINR